ncbi:MAG: UDP-N-acetylglucosamine 2-epimerase [Polaromonas sp.]
MLVICFVTLSRSDYASMRPVALAALADADIDARIVAGGSHCLKRYGNTIEQIQTDGLPVHEVARFLNETDDSPTELASAYARAVAEFVRIFSQQKPDRIFVIGDRWEMLAVVSVASMLQIPIVHHSGGDITQGSADNQTRYALTTLSHLHLVALPQHRDRLIRMGEEEWRVTTTGEPALTALADYAAAVPDIRAHLSLTQNEPFVLATFHPTSFDTHLPQAQIDIFLQALDTITCAIVLTAPNPDAASELFLARYKRFAATRPRVQLRESLGSNAYYAAMAEATYMVGNSSSGMWESSSFKLPVVNIGPRQQGRIHGDNVVNCALAFTEIMKAIAQVEDSAFRAKLSGANPYVNPLTLALILDCLRQPHDRDKLLAKRFVDPLSLR